MSILKNIYNIRSSCSFWDTLAELYLNKFQKNMFQLASALFLVPNRRACHTLTQAFVRKQGMTPTILPKIVPLAEIDDDEIFFYNSLANTSLTKEEKLPINKEERLFLFARLIMSKPNDFGLKQISLAQAISLAIDLGNLIDTACNQGLSFDKLNDLVPEKYATHWQETLKLLKIITEFWPQILLERGAADVCEIKNSLLFQQAHIWNTKKTNQPIIAAGITANFPSIVSALDAIKSLPYGEIYFAGLDCFADDAYWEAIDETHPQFELKELLRLLKLNRHDIGDIIPPLRTEREHLISELMRPASVSDYWRNLKDKINLKKALNGVELIECDTQRAEATAIALKMREVLTFPEKTAALVTYDRNLARRVACELDRFNIKVDDSAGLPLNLSSVGIFLRQLAEVAEMPDSQIKFISLLKHPFTMCHYSAADFRAKAYDYELSLRANKKHKTTNDEQMFFHKLQETLNPLISDLSAQNIEFKLILKHHLEAAESIASSDICDGKKLLWRGDAGKTAAKFFTKLLEQAETLGSINGRDYIPLLTELMGMEMVRSTYGTHPRLSILGPIEARLCQFDYIILGEMNDGIWPKTISADMWMSRPMKQDFGFSLPEKEIGILAADLCGFLSAEHVIMTRAERVDGVPMKKSRWLLRLETILKALEVDLDIIKSTAFSTWSHLIDKPSSTTVLKAPAPCPPLYARPRKLSASGVDLLIQDPYSVFAKYILKLYPLDNLDIPPDQRDYGSLIHAIIEQFNNSYPIDFPDDALSILLNLGHQNFKHSGLEKDITTFWLPKFEKTAEWIIKQETDYRSEVKHVYNEIEGHLSYALPGGDFSFTAKADRIDALKNGEINILDYKTGKIPSKKQVMSGHALQLLLEGLIMRKGTFDGIPAGNIQKLIYWQLGSNILEISPDEENVLEKCEAYLLKLITTFDMLTTPYYSRPIPKYLPKNRDYEHLARIKEWSVQEDESSDD